MTTAGKAEVDPVAGKEPSLVTPVPAGYLAVAALDEASWRELGARRARLLHAIGSAGPGDLPAALAAVLALAAVISEQDARARLHAADQDSPRACTCGVRCHGLAAINDHLDQFPLDGHDAEAHLEVTEAFLAGHQAARTAQDVNATSPDTLKSGRTDSRAGKDRACQPE